MIHEALNKSAIAERYYNIKHPERNYTRQDAVKQFAQDSQIDRQLLLQVVNDVFKEQKELLRKNTVTSGK